VRALISPVREDGGASFPLFARDGSWILAGVSPDPDANAIALARQAHRLTLSSAIELRPPTGRYNCHGLVFASRRAHVPPIDVDVDVDDVLRRDLKCLGRSW